MRSMDELEFERMGSNEFLSVRCSLFCLLLQRLLFEFDKESQRLDPAIARRLVARLEVQRALHGEDGQLGRTRRLCTAQQRRTQ